MQTRFPVPDASRMQRLIAEAFEQGPAPDTARIEHSGERLARRRPVGPASTVNKIPWWIVLLLAGGMATAAWWTGNKLLNPAPGIDQNEQDEIRQPHQWDQTQPFEDGISLPHQGEAGTGVEEEVNEKSEPLIYRRENY